MTFSSKNFQIIRQIISEDLVNHLVTEIDIHKNILYGEVSPTAENPYPWQDTQIEKCFARYSPPYADAILNLLKPKLEEVTKTSLMECYSYVRIYYEGAVMVKHIDRPSCEISATLCLKKISDWPIYIRDLDKNVFSVELNPGDLMVYRGNILPHWRKELTSEHQYQMFLHYIDANGPYAPNNLYDGREMLGSIKMVRKSIISTEELDVTTSLLQLENEDE